MNFNRIIVGGHLTANPELKRTLSGKSVASFSIAYNEKRDEEHKIVYYFPIVVWGNQGETCCKFLKKGSSVLIEGRLTIRTWEDKEGNKHKLPEIVASNVVFCSSAKKQEPEIEEIPVDDDPPF